jgi:hypothetical protein
MKIPHHFRKAAAYAAANQLPPEFNDLAAELTDLTNDILHGPDEYVPIRTLLQLWPWVPDRRWIYSRSERLGARKVTDGERHVEFSLRAARELLGPPVSELGYGHET